MKTVLIFSGGLDSTTLLYDLVNQGDKVTALSINYGQRHKKELLAAAKITMDVGAPFRIADLSSIRPLLGGSSQTSDEISVPEGHYAEESMKLTVVPNRNMIMLSVALGYAISLKFNRVAYAAHGGDHAIYPDCRPEFVAAMQKAASLCDWHNCLIDGPYLGMSKAEIVERGASLAVPFAETWSCYKGGNLHCGKCGTCVERKEAFALAGVPDPTRYEA